MQKYNHEWGTIAHRIHVLTSLSQKGVPSWLSLGRDVWNHIFHMLEDSDFLACACVCTHFKKWGGYIRLRMCRPGFSKILRNFRQQRPIPCPCPQTIQPTPIKTHTLQPAELINGQILGIPQHCRQSRMSYLPKKSAARSHCQNKKKNPRPKCSNRHILFEQDYCIAIKCIKCTTLIIHEPDEKLTDMCDTCKYLRNRYRWY